MAIRFAASVAAVVLMVGSGCGVTPASVVPPIAAGASQSERVAVYKQYRLEPSKRGRVSRDGQTFDVAQFRYQSWGCPAAYEQFQDGPTAPWVAVAAGGFIGVIGGVRLITGGEDQSGGGPTAGLSNEAAAAMVGVGAGVGLLTAAITLWLRPEPPDPIDFSIAYNECLRKTLGVTGRLKFASGLGWPVTAPR